MSQAVAADRTPHQKRAALRRHLLSRLLAEVAVPLGGYYGLRAAGVNPWLALIAPAVLTIPSVRLEGTGGFSCWGIGAGDQGVTVRFVGVVS